MITTQLVGGLGNNLFQMAHCIAHSIKYNLDYCIPLKVECPHTPEQKPYIFKNVKYCKIQPNLPFFSESAFTYKQLDAIDNVCFTGFWQSYLYFNEYRKEVLEIFGFDDIKPKSEVCGLHIRMGDYKGNSNNHPIISKEYIKSALTYMHIMGYSSFTVFSDEIGKARELIDRLHLPYSFEFSEGRGEIEDLRLMASCGSQITANSTFSWWAAYINPNPYKKIVMPKNWFGRDMQHDTKDLYLPGAFII